MIKNILKPISANLRPFSFGSYQEKVLDSFSNTLNSFEPMKKANDAQRVFE